MLSSMCAVSAYADEPAAETPTLTISVPDVASTYTQWNATSELKGVTDISAYTIMWHYTTADGPKTATANADGSIGWIADRLVNGSDIYAVATNNSDSSKINSNVVKVSYTDIVTGVSVAPNSGSLTKGATPNELQFTATVSPSNAANKNVTWSVSPTDVVSIDETGKVTVLDSATTSQTVTVTATSVATPGQFGTATISVTVPAPAVTLTGVTASYDANTRTVTATPTFENGTPTSGVEYVWSVSSASGATGVSYSVDASDKAKCVISNSSANSIVDIKVDVTVTYNSVSKTASLTSISVPGSPKSMTVTVAGGTEYSAGKTYTLSAWENDTKVTSTDLKFDIEGDNQGSSISDDQITFGFKATSVTVKATASGYNAATKVFTVKPVELAAAKSPLTAGKNDSTALTAKYYDKTDISGVTWSITSRDGADDASIDGNTLKAGAKSGSVTCTAKAGETELGTVTVVINPNSAIDFTLYVTGNSTAGTAVDTIYAKKGVITLTAANAIDTSKGNAAVSGTFKFSFASNPDTPVGGIGLTDHGNGVATVSGNYNGTYIIRADFYLTGATTPAATKYHTIYVNYTPTFVGGNYAVWDGVNGLDFLVDDSIYNYNGQIWVDGHLLSDANYLCRSSSDGRIWVTLKPEFISWLRQYYNGNGTHTIAVGINNRNAATGYFKTWGTASSFNGVKTGDEANLGLWITLLTVSAAGTAAAVVLYKRKKTNG